MTDGRRLKALRRTARRRRSRRSSGHGPFADGTRDARLYGMAAAGTEPRPEPPRVLLAEDDEPFRQLLAAELVGAGFEVVQARDGIELLAQVEALLARHQRPETFVIVSDVQMPGLGGLDVLAVLRCARLRTPIILITAFGDEETTAEARDHGATAVLRKPFDLASLRARVLDAAPP